MTDFAIIVQALSPTSILVLASVVCISVIGLTWDWLAVAVRRRTARTSQHSKTMQNQLQEGPAPDPKGSVSEGSDAAPDAMSTAQTRGGPQRATPKLESFAFGDQALNAAVLPFGFVSSVAFGARKTRPAPRLVSRRMRCDADAVARTFVSWLLEQGHKGEWIRADVCILANRFARETAVVLHPNDAFFAALFGVAGVERIRDRPVRGPNGQRTLTTYTFYDPAELSAIARVQKLNRRAHAKSARLKAKPTLPAHPTVAQFTDVT